MSGSDLTPQKEDGPPNAEATAEAKGVETAPLQQAHEVVDETKSSVVERDEFGLPIKNALRKKVDYDTSSDESKSTAESPANGSISNSTSVHTLQEKEQSLETRAASRRSSEDGCKDEEDSKGHDSAKDEKRGSKTAPAELSDVLGGNTGTASGWSHQALAPQKVEQDVDEKEDEWQEMPAYAPYDIYNDDNKLIAREAQDSDDEAAYKGLGGAGKGYTRIQMDDDAKSASSMEENTEYLFKAKGTEVYDEDEEARDPLAQLQATKDLLTEGQRIAYVGVTRLNMVKMTKSLEDLESTKKTRKSRGVAIESMSMWAQKMMVRLYLHMDINSSGMSLKLYNSTPFPLC